MNTGPARAVRKAALQALTSLALGRRLLHIDADIYRRFQELPVWDRWWYLSQYPDVRDTGWDPLSHYLRFGLPEQRDPGPNYNVRERLGRHFLKAAQPPELAQALIADVAMLGIEVPNNHEPDSTPGTDAREARHADLRRKALRHTLELLPLEPELLAAVRQLEADTLPVVDAVRRDRIASAWRKLYVQLQGSYRYVIFVPWISHGGADLVAIHIARLGLELHSPNAILLVLTESADMSAKHWLPGGLHTLVLSDLAPALLLDERVELMLLMVRALKPRALLNINSHAAWELYERFGRALSRFTDLYGALFCPDYDSKGRIDGYAHRYFRSNLPLLRGIYFDNASFIDELWRFYLPAQHLRTRLRTIYQPTALTGTYSPPPSAQRFNVLWAGRLSRQKNLPTLINVAKIDPLTHFEVYGRGDEKHIALMEQAQGELSNLHFHGPYSNFSALPLNQCQVYVYTTLWDGLPNALLEAAAAGIPIVAPDVGGISELVSDSTGWLVADPNDAAAYAHALQEIRERPEEALRRASNMKALVAQRHSWSTYSAAMAAAPSFLEA